MARRAEAPSRTRQRISAYQKACSLVPAGGIDQYSPAWLAAKLLEGDSVVAHKVSAASDQAAVKAFLAENKDGSLYTSDCKFAWIETLLSGVVTRPKKTSQLLTKFDRAAISKRWGKVIAVGIVLLEIMLSMIVAAPLMGLGGQIPVILRPLIENSGVPAVIASFINGTIVTALGWVFPWQALCSASIWYSALLKRSATWPAFPMCLTTP